MTTMQWRPVVNALTKPQSYRPQFVPRGTSGYAKMAADIAAAHPNYNADLLQSVAPLIMAWIQQELINGWQVTFEDAFTFRPLLTGRMNGPDDPLPDHDDLIQINVYAARPYVQGVRTQVKLERMPMQEKLPQVTSSEDMKLKLADVLNSAGVLRLTGSNLYFDEGDPDSGCTISGTESGESKQSTFASISNTEILLVPEIPEQTEPWNNEYTVTVTAQYTEHGTPRTGLYRRRLRTPLAVESFNDVGLLTGNGALSPFAIITDGEAIADERLRIQAVIDSTADCVLLNLIDMKEGGAAGLEISVAADGTYVLPGFTDSAVSSLTVEVQNYVALKTLVRNYYGSRLVDILDITAQA